MFKLIQRDYNDVCSFVVVSVFPKCSMLEVENKKFRPNIQIIREMSSLEPAPNKGLESEIQVPQKTKYISQL